METKQKEIYKKKILDKVFYYFCNKEYEFVSRNTLKTLTNIFDKINNLKPSQNKKRKTLAFPFVFLFYRIHRFILILPLTYDSHTDSHSEKYANQKLSPDNIL